MKHPRTPLLPPHALRGKIEEKILSFRQPAGTSRGVYTTRRVWYVTLHTPDGRQATGECAPLPGLSPEAGEGFGTRLREALDLVCRLGHIPAGALEDCSSIRFGLECALHELRGGVPAAEGFLRGQWGIPTNGLVWMGTRQEMARRAGEKLRAGFRCLKLKIGAIDFGQELELLERIRRRHSSRDLELRVDANGAFPPDQAMDRLRRLAPLGLHSIEQPIAPSQWEAMAALCRDTPLPIALDEELIGVHRREEKARLLDSLCPQHIVLKPTLHGGLSGCDEWIALAQERGIGWWATSALESNVGLAHIARWLSAHRPTRPQGLGTGLLYTNNTPPLTELRGDELYYLG